MVVNAIVDSMIRHEADSEVALCIEAQVESEFARLAADLGGPDPSPSELLLAQSAAASHALASACKAQVLAAVLGRDDASAAHLDALLRRAERSNRQLCTVLKTLAIVRRLARPRPPSPPSGT